MHIHVPDMSSDSNTIVNIDGLPSALVGHIEDKALLPIRSDLRRYE